MTHELFDKYLAGVILKRMITQGVIELNTPKPTDYSHLEGVGIHVAAAARKYNIPHPTISRWAKQGYIRIIGREKNRLCLNEAQVAFLAALYSQNPGAGKRVIEKYFKAN